MAYTVHGEGNEMPAKKFIVPVLTGADDCHTQFARIMNTPGYSHVIHRSTFSSAGRDLPIAYVLLAGYTNKKLAQKAVSDALGDSKWVALNTVTEYEAAKRWGMIK